jgi:Arm DNA-binding domain
LKYRFEKKKKRVSLGVYPEATLKEARDRRDVARKQLTDGIDPCANRKAVKATKSERA